MYMCVCVSYNTRGIIKTIKQLDPDRTNIREERKAIPLLSRRETERMKSWDIDTLEKKREEKKRFKLLKAFWYFSPGSWETALLYSRK